MIRLVVLEVIVLGLFVLFALNLNRARTTGNIMYAGTTLASRTKQPKVFWSMVVFNALMLALMGYCAVDLVLS